MFLVHPAVEEDLVLLLERLPGRGIGAEMATETEIGTGTGTGTGTVTVSERGTETKIGTGTKTRAVDETITGTLIETSGEVAMMWLMIEKMYPNRVEGAHAVVPAAVAEVEAAGETEAEIGSMRKVGRAAEMPAL